jgi:hypothetical protein
MALLSTDGGQGSVDGTEALGDATGIPEASGAGLWAMTLAVAPIESVTPSSSAIDFGRFIPVPSFTWRPGRLLGQRPDAPSNPAPIAPLTHDPVSRWHHS